MNFNELIKNDFFMKGFAFGFIYFVGMEIIFSLTSFLYEKSWQLFDKRKLKRKEKKEVGVIND